MALEDYIFIGYYALQALFICVCTWQFYVRTPSRRICETPCWMKRTTFSLRANLSSAENMQPVADNRRYWF
jgi:hypothetical protein